MRCSLLSSYIIEEWNLLDKLVCARMKEEDFVFLKRVCEAQDETVSSLVRRAIGLELTKILNQASREEEASNSSKQNQHQLHITEWKG
jgi:hypothetical protein